MSSRASRCLSASRCSRRSITSRLCEARDRSRFIRAKRSEDQPQADSDDTPQEDARGEDEKQGPATRPFRRNDSSRIDQMHFRRCQIPACDVGFQAAHGGRRINRRNPVSTRSLTILAQPPQLPWDRQNLHLATARDHRDSTSPDAGISLTSAHLLAYCLPEQSPALASPLHRMFGRRPSTRRRLYLDQVGGD
jgi:hypothetical protein